MLQQVTMEKVATVVKISESNKLILNEMQGQIGNSIKFMEKVITSTDQLYN